MLRVLHHTICYFQYGPVIVHSRHDSYTIKLSFSHTQPTTKISYFRVLFQILSFDSFRTQRKVDKKKLSGLLVQQWCDDLIYFLHVSSSVIYISLILGFLRFISFLPFDYRLVCGFVVIPYHHFCGKMYYICDVNHSNQYFIDNRMIKTNVIFLWLNILNVDVAFCQMYANILKTVQPIGHTFLYSIRINTLEHVLWHKSSSLYFFNVYYQIIASKFGKRRR